MEDPIDCDYGTSVPITYRYEVDETSPEETMVEALYDEEGYTYQILCKKTTQKNKRVENSSPPKNAASNGD